MEIENLEWLSIDSSKISKMAYENNNLYVIFRNKSKEYSIYTSIYKYTNVPKSVFIDILNKKYFDKFGNRSYGATMYQLIEKNKTYEFTVIKSLSKF